MCHLSSCSSVVVGETFASARESRLPVLGFIVNPVAGMGGRVGLHGSDGTAALEAAQRGALPVSGDRAKRGLSVLRGIIDEVRIVTVGGDMGGDLVQGQPQTQIVTTPNVPTSSSDTTTAVKIMANMKVDLILFAGGDGTARDVASAVSDGIPIVGIPAGVKMHSGVFGVTPEAAGELAARYLRNPSRDGLIRVDVLDVVADSGATPTAVTAALVPFHRDRLQKGKVSRSISNESDLNALCFELASQVESGGLYVLGPGTTTGRIGAILGLETTINGVDVIEGGVVVAADVGERELLDLVQTEGGVRLVLGVIGGQGFLLGRGNQQISPLVLERIGIQNVVVIAAQNKLASLFPPSLYVDIGVDRKEVFGSFIRVRTGVRQSRMMKVVSC